MAFLQMELWTLWKMRENLNCIFYNLNKKYSYFYIIAFSNYRDRLMESYLG
jgi:hypothetical protein